jgi:hypothetical protein
MNWKRMLAYVTGSVDEERLGACVGTGKEDDVAGIHPVAHRSPGFGGFSHGRSLDRRRFDELLRADLHAGGHSAGVHRWVTTSPDSAWMQQMARNMTLADIGFLGGCRYLLHDRDAKFRAAFDGILESVGIQAVTLPPRSPNSNAHCERWIESVKAEALSKMILFGEASLRHVLSRYVEYHHSERNHQGKGNVILFPKPADRIGESSEEIFKRERLGGLLKFYHREAA